jgi:UDP-N-acetylmuramoyl-L-alanyl-D-glutamate--2,6-diaminopimelate ligase
MRLTELLDGLDVVVTADKPTAVDRAEIASATEDSRNVTPGALFAALPGLQTDGRRYIGDAIARGAVAVLTQRAEPLPPGVVAIISRHPRAVFGRICARLAGSAVDELVMLGVTGTNGKTTVTHLLRDLLHESGLPCGRIGTVDNDLGDPLASEPASFTTPPAESLHHSFARMRENGLTHAVMEVSSQALDQDRCAGIEFSYAAFTNLTRDHLDYHGTMSRYADAKARLFDMVGREGAAALNGDDPWVASMLRRCRCRAVTFGLRQGNAYRAVESQSDLGGSRFRVLYPGGVVDVQTPLVGEYNVRNALTAFTVAHSLGLAPATIAENLRTLTGAPGRLEPVLAADGRELPFRVFVDYAHTPDALANALQALRAVEPDRPLSVVFGCGGDRDATKRPEMGEIAARLADRVIVTSDNPRSEDPGAIIDDIFAGIPESARGAIERHDNREAAIGEALHGAAAGETVLIAGKGHETYQIIGRERRHFDDRAVARSILDEIRPGRLTHLGQAVARRVG